MNLVNRYLEQRMTSGNFIRGTILSATVYDENHNVITSFTPSNTAIKISVKKGRE